MLKSLFYAGGIDLPMRQARAVQTLHTARALAAHGCRVTLAAARTPRRGLVDVLAGYGLSPHPNLTILSLPTVRLPELPLAALAHPRLAVRNWSYALSALLALRLLPADRRPALVLARDPRVAWLFLHARGFSGARVVYEVHEIFSTGAREPVSRAGPLPLLRIPRLRRLEQSVFNAASHCITLTECCRQLLVREFGVSPERVFVAPDAVAHVPAQLPRRAAETRRVVYAGQLYPWKGVDTLVRALAFLPRARLKIVGGLAEGDPHAQALRALARELALADRIDFTGFIPHHRVAGAISDSAAAVIPLPDNPMARYFTSPLKLYEYMAAGLPIVATDLPAIREVLRHDQNALLVPPGDAPAMAAALDRLLSEPELAERLRSRAFEDVKDRTWASRAAIIAERLDV